MTAESGALLKAFAVLIGRCAFHPKAFVSTQIATLALA